MAKVKLFVSLIYFYLREKTIIPFTTLFDILIETIELDTT